MKRHRLIGAAMAGFLALALAPMAADDGGFSLSVLVDGASRPEYSHRGKVYVEALRGEEYGLRITNPLSCRVAVALSVDGLNTIDAKHGTPKKAAKWVLGPYESIVISGWQVNGEEARRFYFTGEKHSYGAWLGETDDLGIIEAVFYREKERYYPPHVTHPRRSGSYEDKSAGRNAPSSAPAPQSRDQESAKSESAEPGLSDDYAATGIGDRVDHEVEWVRMELESSPSAVVRIRYEFRPELVKLGVLPRPRPYDEPIARRERSRGFEGSYCPEP